jgi:hypothetical protein
MKKWYFISVVLLTLSLIPNKAFACGKKKSCKTEQSTSKMQKNCCCGNNSKNNHNGCNGKCGHSSCINPVVNIVANVTPTISIQTNPIVSVNRKTSFFYNQIQLSSGFYTIWLIPKISLS